MAGLHTSLRPQPPSSAANHHSFTAKLLLLLTLLPLSLAIFAFLLQWRGGGVDDPISRWSPDESHKFPGMDSSPLATICITTSTSASLEQILPWMFYHKVIGVSTFFLFVEGKAASPAVSKVLESIPAFGLIYRSCALVGIKMACLQQHDSPNLLEYKEAGMDWILHLDTDELMHPAGAREYSLRQLLLDVPPNVDMESSVERDDIKEPFTEVSMFKKNYDHLTKDTYFGMYKESTRGNPNYFLTYGNGKSAARVQDHLRPNGAHRWHNYMKTPNEIKLEEAAVLHYTYAKFSDLTSRRDRCGCKPTKEDVKRCFMLEFDRATIIQGLRESGIFASIIASGQGSLSKDNFLASIESSNSSRTTSSVSLKSRKMGSRESQSTARKILEINTSYEFHEVAVPPLSPPVMDRDLMIEELNRKFMNPQCMPSASRKPQKHPRVTHTNQLVLYLTTNGHNR
ncbi:hypothetical protein DH2020_002858 [Rehmannia glutinosa]|uniref:Glycosyltransferase family 92 protein n=1 Tax=Rehmannia glutinosa TaxID=99300 RepID=A0ABR0XUZ1_REHGL